MTVPRNQLTLDELRCQIESLSQEEKIRLVQGLLSSWSDRADLLEAIAVRVAIDCRLEQVKQISQDRRKT